MSTEAIYQYVYTSPIASKWKLYKYLPQRRLSRQKRGERIPRTTIPDRISIHKRDVIANEKVELGHFEADLTFHQGNSSKNIGVMVDKLTQKVMLTYNRCKKSLTVTTGFLLKMNSIPKELRKTLTMDNGKEFVRTCCI